MHMVVFLKDTDIQVASLAADPFMRALNDKNHIIKPSAASALGQLNMREDV